MKSTIRFCGPARYQLLSAAALFQSAVETSVRRALKAPRQPGCNWFFEVGTEILRGQLSVAFQMGDVNEMRRYLDSFDVNSHGSGLNVTQVSHEKFRGRWFVPRDIDPRVTVLYLHGGGYSFYPRSYAHLISLITLAAKSKSFALDYRLTPENRFPAQLEDALAAYHWLLQEGTNPENVIVAGDSAGANLALALLLALRDARIPSPALAVVLSPPTDFEAVRASLRNYRGYDWIDGRMLERWVAWFCDSTELGNPLVCPARADLRGLPPIYVQAGRSEILFDSIQAFADQARRQGADVVLESWEHMNHVFQMFAPDVPQSVEALHRIGEVVDAHGRDCARSEVLLGARM